MDSWQVFFGSVLGDGCITPSCMRYKRKYRHFYTEKHGLKQEEYLLWKKELLPFPTVVWRGESRRIRIQSTTNDICDYYRIVFYPMGKKIIPEFILSKLDIEGLLVWYLDDGNWHYYPNHARLSLHAFEDKTGILNKLETMGFNGAVDKQGIFNMTVEASKSFRHSILPYASIIPNSMHYKLGLDEARRRIGAERYDYWWRNVRRRQKSVL